MEDTNRTKRPQKPSDPAHLTLEAWSQGMMVSTLVFMAMLTVANMRRKVLLHKLILIEVSYSASFQKGYIADERTAIAHHRHSQRLLHISQPSAVRMVYVLHCDWHDHLMEPAQHNNLDKEQTAS